MPLTVDGFDALRAADYLTLIRDDVDTRLIAAGYAAVDYDRDLVFGTLTAVMSVLLGDESEALQAIYDARDPNNATGVQLSSLSAGVGVLRNAATYSTVLLTLSGTAGTIVTAGLKVRGGGASDDTEWTLTEDVTLDGGGSYVGAVFQAVEPGAKTASPGDVDTIVTPLFGLDSVTNPAVAVVGQDRETDTELRLRRAQSLQISGGRAAAALRSNLLAIDDLDAAIVLENDQPYPQTFDGNTVPANAVLVSVGPSSISTTVKQEVAEAIYDLITPGIKAYGTDVTIEAVGTGLSQKDISFNLVSDVSVDIVATITIESAGVGLAAPPSFSEVQAALIAVWSALFPLSTGDDVLILDLYAAASTVEGLRTIDSLTINGVAADLTITVNQRAVLGATPVVSP